MTAGPPETVWRSAADLLVLHAVRLAGFAGHEAVADRVDLPTGVVDATLRALDGQHMIEWMTFADAGGWVLTNLGRTRDAELLRHELDVTGARHILQSTTDQFEAGINSELVRVVTEWQLRSPTDVQQVSAEILRELTALNSNLSDLMADVVGRLPRFGRYPRQFAAALENARRGDPRWVAGVGLLSCHVVWAELHQDLLSSLGRERSA